jgi:type IV pilus assembly protein PilO
MNLDDLRNIDFKNVGALPLPVKAVLLLGLLLTIVALGAFLVWKPKLEELNQARDEEWGPDKRSGLRGTFESKLAMAANLDAYKKQLEEAEQKSNILLQQLPDKSQIDGLLADINQAGIGRGLEFELFKPGAEKPSTLYAVLPITIRVNGTYHDLGAFAADVAKMPRIVTLGDITIMPEKEAKTAPGKLTMDATAKTYRALDRNEMQNATEKKAGGKGSESAKH